MKCLFTEPDKREKAVSPDIFCGCQDSRIAKDFLRWILCALLSSQQFFTSAMTTPEQFYRTFNAKVEEVLDRIFSSNKTPDPSFSELALTGLDDYMRLKTVKNFLLVDLI